MNEKRILEMDSYEQKVLANILNDKRKSLIEENKDNDFIDEILEKVIDAPIKKKSLFKKEIGVIWFALLVAPYLSSGLIGIINNLPTKMNAPFDIEICKDSLKTVFIFLLCYLLGIGIYISSKRNYRRGEEYGSAIWGIASQINKKYMQKPQYNNKILTQNIKIGLKAQKHRRNLNTLVCGGSGAGKTRFYVKPNILQCNCSYVILDPKRRNFTRYRKFIRKRGIQNKNT